MVRFFKALFFLMLFWVPSTQALIVENIAAPNASCDGGVWNVDFYGNFQGHLWDRYNANNESYVSGNSRVQVYIRGAKMSIPNGWVQPTSYAPSAGGYYVAWNNQLSWLTLANLVPADRGTPVAQVTYVIRRALRSDNGTLINSNYYSAPFVAGATPAIVNHGNLGLRFDTAGVFQDRECYNIYPRWCGDAVRDAEELCDPNDSSRSGLAAGQSCNASCQPVTLLSNTSCTSARVSSAAISAGWSNTFSCSALVPNAATMYHLDCGNGQTSSSTTSSITCNYASAGVFTPRCRVDAEAAALPACTASVTVTNPGGGGSSSVCQAISLSAASSNVGSLSSTITCTSNLPAAANLYEINCGNGTSFSGSLNRATCNYGAGVFRPQCRVNSESSPAAACIGTITVTGGPSWGGGGGSGWSGGPSWGGGASYCGDGVIQRPNASGVMESCDAGRNNGTSGYACDAHCQIGSTNPGGMANTIRMTNPGRMGDLSLTDYRAVVGDGVRVFSDSDALSFFATYPIYISGKDTYVTNTSPIISGSDVSRSISEEDLCVGPVWSVAKIGTSSTDGSGSLVWAYRDIDCVPSYVLWSWSQLRNFRGDTGPLRSAEAYRETSPDEFVVGIRFLQENLRVRVSKPLVSNTVGGNAYLARATGYDVNTIVDSFLENLKHGNFITVSTVSSDLWAGRNLSSATATSVRAVPSNSTQISELSSVSSGNFSGDFDVRSEGDFDTLPKLGDDDRIRLLRNGTLTIGTPSRGISFTKVRTIVVENGTLRISGNLDYANQDGSYAFVVKNGKILIDSGVTKIAGVFLVMNGSIEGSGIKTPNRLSVDGNLYGNSAPLVEDRTYVRANNFSSAITTGVTVNYSSRAIRNPPPLLSQFVEQYTIGKVAK